MKKKDSFKLMLAVFVLLILAACMGEDKSKNAAEISDEKATMGPITITMGVEGQAGLPDVMMGQKFKELVEERAKGRIKVDYYLNGQLGSDDELLLQIMNGTMNAAMISTSTFSDYTPELDALQLPFLFSSYEEERDALNSPEAKALMKSIERLNVKILGICEIGRRHFANNIRPIEKVEDLKGIKMRVVPSTLVKNAATAVGMSVTPMSYGEIYTGLQQKVIDGEEVNLISISEERHFEVLEFVSLIGFYTFPSSLCFSKTFLEEKFSIEDQAMIQSAADEAFEFAMDQTQKAEEESLKIIKENGLKVNEIAELEVNRFKETVEFLYEEYAAKEDVMRDFINSVRN